jgi:hypothetical protein
MTETRQALNPVFLIQAVPGADGVVADNDEGGHLFRTQGGHHYDLMPATLTI